MLFQKKRTEVVPRVNIEPNFHFIQNKKDLNKHFDDIMRLPYWVFDTETSGLDPHSHKVILMQIGNKDVQYLIDTREVEIDRFKERFEDESSRKFLQNALFDYKMMLGNFGIHVEGMRDTMLAEMLLTCGYQKFGFSMENQALKYLNVQLDKRMQKSFVNHHGQYSMQQLHYAAMDCIIPDHVLRFQWNLLEREHLKRVFRIECDAIPAFGDMEYYGLLLDKEQWLANISKEEKELEGAMASFMKAAGEHVGVDMFGTPDINPNSSAQILKLFQKVFGEKLVVDENGKPGTGEPVLEKLLDKFPNDIMITSLLKIRGHQKRIGTYGMSYIKHIHPKTERFHPRVNQIGTETGRPAGKKPNMLNIPADPTYRHPWIAGPGRKILTDDYGACELRIMASMSGDPVMCKGFNDGLDYHTFTAAQFILDDEPYLREFIQGKEPGKNTLGDYILDENGEKQANPNFGKPVPYNRVLKHHRTVAKTINFGLAYGMGAAKLSRTLGISLEKAREYVKQFNETFAVLVAWLKENQEMAVILRSCSYQELERAEAEKRDPRPDLAYSETHLGRKRYFRLPNVPPLVQIADRYQRYSTDKTKLIDNRFFNPELPEDKKTNPKKKRVPVYEWKAEGCETLKFDPTNPWDENMPKSIQKYYMKMAAIKREGGNSPIQGGNADITKLAMYKMRKWIRSVEKERNNDQYLAHVALQVYDELIVDCPDWLADEAASMMDKLMQEAGQEVITKVPVETGCIIENSWVKG